MNKRLERLSDTPPRPASGDKHLNDFVDHHVRNAHRLRAETLNRHAIAVGNLVRALGAPVRRLKAAVSS